MRTATTRARRFGRHQARRAALVIGLTASVAIGTVALVSRDNGSPATPTAVLAPQASDVTAMGSSGLDSIGAKRREQYAATLDKPAIVEPAAIRTPRPGFPTDRPNNP